LAERCAYNLVLPFHFYRACMMSFILDVRLPRKHNAERFC
jgi:hypothetical protein